MSTRRPTIFGHSVNVEWGHGIVVEENPGKVYLYFEHGGRRAFLNDPKKRAGPLPKATRTRARMRAHELRPRPVDLHDASN